VTRKRSTVPWELLPEPNDRRDWQLLSSLVGIVTVTGRIIGERPESLLIVGPSGCGKTELLRRYDFRDTDPRNQHIIFAANLSAWGLSEILLQAVPRGVSHLIAPEMQTLMLRQGKVWDALAGLLLPALEEGVGDVYNGPVKKSYEGARVGLIGAITTDAYNMNRGDLRESGLLSRMLVVHWRRDPENVLRSQLRANAGDTAEIEKVHVELQGRIHVNISHQVADVITRYAHEVEPLNAYRAARRFRALSKAIAYLEGREAVTKEHVTQLREFARFWKPY
jgi:hypothetical protein